jgi:hypothetical protein
MRERKKRNDSRHRWALPPVRTVPVLVYCIASKKIAAKNEYCDATKRMTIVKTIAIDIRPNIGNLMVFTSAQRIIPHIQAIIKVGFI